MTYKGKPFRGSSFIFKESDPARSKPQRSFESYSRIFCSTSQDEMTELADIYTKVANKTAFINDLDKKCIEKDDECVWYIYIVWTEEFYKQPE